MSEVRIIENSPGASLRVVLMRPPVVAIVESCIFSLNKRIVVDVRDVISYLRV
jgi:hypothetical protein